MIKEDLYWYNIIPSQLPVLDDCVNVGKWMCFGSKEVMHLYIDLLNTLVENGSFRSVKISKKDPKHDLFPHKECVICVFTSDDETEKAHVQKHLKEIGLDPKEWKSDKQTHIDWSEKGKLFLEAEIIKKKKRLSTKTKTTKKTIDTFLCHNSSNKPIVKELGTILQNRGITVWLDEWNLIPGRSWQEELESTIETIQSALILVGKDELGPWQNREMRAFISEFVDRDLPVIPVLLPGNFSQPRLPIFLKSFTWVDLREGLTHQGVNKIIWGITGNKPNEKIHHKL
jgi:hypothetical protein